jgi:hypothetical protein
MEYLAVGLGPAVIGTYIMYLHVQHNVDDLKKNWVQYRCHPAYMPFASMMREDVSTTENFQYCMSLHAKTLFDNISGPIFALFGMLTGGLQKIVGDLQHFLQYIAGIDTFIFSFVNQIFEKIQTSFSVFASLMGRIRTIMSRITSSAVYSAFVIQTTVEFALSIVQFLYQLLKSLIIMIFALGIILVLFFPVLLAFFIPLGALFGLSFSCFHPNTPIDTDRGRIRLSEVLVGDTVRGSKVTTVMYFDTKDVDLYSYNGICVSGEHIVQHHGAWLYVKDTGCPLFTGTRPTYIICLNTDDNKIRIGQHIFADYEEVSSRDACLKIEKLVWGHPVFQTYSPALNPESTVVLKDGRTVRLDQVELGTEMAEGTVRGIMIIDGSGIEWYNIKGSLVSGCQPIYQDKPVLAKSVGELSERSPVLAIQIVVENTTGWFTIDGNLTVRDYPDSHDQTVLDKIQTVVLNELNKKVVSP